MLNITLKEKPGEPNDRLTKAAKRVHDSIDTLFEVKLQTGYFKAHPHGINEHAALTQVLLDHCVDLQYNDGIDLNSQAQENVMNTMMYLDMMHYSTSPVTPEQWKTVPEPTHDDAFQDAEFLAASDAVTGQHFSWEPTIPSHKMETNDFWYVTPSEISSALEAYDNAIEKRQNPDSVYAEIMSSPIWHKWLGFLRLAVRYGGFRVW